MKTRLLTALLLGASAAAAQRLDEAVERLAMEAARSYVGPIVSGFGSNLNSGWFHRAPPGRLFSPTLEAGVVGMFSSFKDAPKRFATEGRFRFDRAQAEVLVDSVHRALERDPRWALLGEGEKQAIRDSLIRNLTRVEFQAGISGPTVIGEKDDSVRVAFRGDSVRVTMPATALTPAQDTVLAIPAREVALGVGGLLENLPLLPLAAPQLTVGTLAGTVLALRWLPAAKITPELGSFRYFGIGIQHNPAAWLPVRMPLDVSGGFFAQRLEIGEAFVARAWAAGITASKTLGRRRLSVTPYGGFMLEGSAMEVEYAYRIELPDGPLERTVRFQAAGDNRGRMTLGLGLRLYIVNLNADYSFATYDALSVGLMIGI